MKQLICLALAALAFGCGGTRVKVINSSGTTATSIEVQATTAASGGYFKLTFSNVTSGLTTEAQNWDDSTNRTVNVTCSGVTCSNTTNLVLTDGKTNILTIPAGGAIVLSTE